MTTSSITEAPTALDTCPSWCLKDHARDVAERAVDPGAGTWHFGKYIDFEGRTDQEVVVRHTAWEDRPGVTPESFIEINDADLTLVQARELVELLTKLVAEAEEG